jgi:hypothetical protein
VGSGDDQGALFIEMAIEDSTNTFVDRGLGEVDIELLQSGDANVIFLEVSAQFMEIGQRVLQRESIDVISPNVKAIEVGVYGIAARLIWGMGNGS